jgi:hypothetical protein
MRNKLAILTAALALLSIGSVMAADQPGRQSANPAVEQASPVSGFGSGTGMGPGGVAGSTSSLASGFGSPISSSGSGSQTFGGGFDPQQTAGSGLLSNPSVIGAGTGGGTLGP